MHYLTRIIDRNALCRAQFLPSFLARSGR